MPQRSFSLLAAILLATALVAAQSTSGAIKGQVRDTSDAVVPGVTVELTVGSRAVGVAVSDERGEFTFEDVPVGPVSLRMTLDGFEPGTLPVDLQPGVTAIVSAVLRVASLAERVLVTAPAPPLPPPPPPPPPPEPRYEVQPVPLGDLESVCGPAKAFEVAPIRGALGEHRREPRRRLFRMEDEINVDTPAGSSFVVGQNLVARRYFRPRDGKVLGEQTIGVVQIVSARAAGTIAVVIHACSDLRPGDLLMPFIPEPVLFTESSGTPDFRDPARILFGGNNEMLGAPGRMMVIDRGSLHGIRVGQRVTLFRRGGDRTVIGMAVVTAVRDDSARILIEQSSTAVLPGDSAAPHVR